MTGPGKKAEEREERTRRAKERDRQRTLVADKLAGVLAEDPDMARAMAEGRYLSGLLHADIVKHLPRPVPVAPGGAAIAQLRSTAEPDVLETNNPAHARGWTQAPSGALVPPPGVEFRLDIEGVRFTPAELLAALDAAEIEAANGWRVYERVWSVNEDGEIEEAERVEIAPRRIRHDEDGPRWLHPYPVGIVVDMTLQPMKFIAERYISGAEFMAFVRERQAEYPDGNIFDRPLEEIIADIEGAPPRGSFAAAEAHDALRRGER